MSTVIRSFSPDLLSNTDVAITPRKRVKSLHNAILTNYYSHLLYQLVHPHRYYHRKRTPKLVSVLNLNDVGLHLRYLFQKL